MESADNMEHFLFKGVYVRFLGAVEFCTVKDAFAAAARRTDIPAGVAADTFAELALEVGEPFFRAHGLNFFDFRKTVCVVGFLGLADLFVLDHMVFSFTYMAAFQHSVGKGAGFFPVNGLEDESVRLV